MTRATTASPWWTSARPSLWTVNSIQPRPTSNGKIVFGPMNADGVGVFDPSDNSFELVDISSTISVDGKFAGAASCERGKIIFAPYDADGVGVCVRATTASPWWTSARPSLRTSNSSGLRLRATARSSSGPEVRTVWECLTRATTASSWWTSARPSLRTQNSVEPRPRATARSSSGPEMRTVWECLNFVPA